MTFNSLSFLIFFVMVYALYLVASHKWQNRVLLIASYFFYGCWNWRFLSLIALSTVIDFTVGRKLDASDDIVVRKRWLFVSMFCNLGILGFFKYFNFFSQSLLDLFQAMNLNMDFSTLNIILPVGISFYTFQTMSYTIDIYRKELKPCQNFFDFALFVSFFPQLVAGPIERAKNLLPNVVAHREINYEKIRRGLFLIVFGLFKKVVIADGVAPSVNQIFNATGGGVSGIDVVLASYLFALQIYCDFSGYSDVARGVSKMMGFELMENFKVPYISKNPSEFWKRWHISLSSWLSDYLYIPLGGNRNGKVKTYRNLMITMILGGLWHGAAWNFVLWGTYQGLILVIYRFFRRKNKTKHHPFVNFLSIVFFFQLTCYGWLLFRANSFDQIVNFTQLIFRFDGFHSLIRIPSIATLIGIVLLLIYDLLTAFHNSAAFYFSYHKSVRAFLYALCLFILMMGMTNAPAEFIYFQF
jgi:D-alanyl-lipoteichoic acid acyltransferase DltB (MBOAT superfamily)